MAREGIVEGDVQAYDLRIVPMGPEQLGERYEVVGVDVVEVTEDELAESWLAYPSTERTGEKLDARRDRPEVAISVMGGRLVLLRDLGWPQEGGGLVHEGEGELGALVGRSPSREVEGDVEVVEADDGGDL